MDVHLSLKESCLEFSKKTVVNVANLLHHELKLSGKCLHTDKLDESQTLYFSIPFQGKVSGEFLFGMDLATAIDLVGEVSESDDNFEELKDEVFDTFKEILNWSAGQTLGTIQANFESVTISAPKVTMGQIVFPKAPMYRNDLLYGNGRISCYLYMDSMMTELMESLQESERKNKALQKTHEDLIRANKAKSEFLAHMSHELRTPLNGIIGIIDLLKTTPLSSYQTRQMETVSKSGELLLEIINDILEFSKIETGKISLDEKPFSIREMVEGFVGTMACQVYTKGLDFYIDLPSVVPEKIIADQLKIKQILTNLVGNAIKFTPKGSIRLKVEFAHKQGQDYLGLEVCDTGVGIPKSKLETIFQSFTQADVSDTRKYGGSGLGLSITKAIVDKMKGQIKVESVEAEGTSFKLEIPIQTQGLECPEKSQDSGPIGLYSTDQNEIDRISSEVSVLSNSKIQLLSQQDLNQLKPDEYSRVIIDWALWNQLPGQTKKNLESLEYIAFFIPPNCIPDVEWNLAKLSQLKYGLLLKPSVRDNLREVLNSEVYQIKNDQNLLDSGALPEESFEANDQSPRILVVDDNAINLEVARVMLAKQGYTVDVAFDGVQAVDKVNQHFYDLVLMDCQMPNMDGYEATVSIRKFKSNKAKIPVIGFTANAFKEVKQKCFDSGMTDFVTKPIKQDQLVKIVKKYVA